MIYEYLWWFWDLGHWIHINSSLILMIDTCEKGVRPIEPLGWEDLHKICALFFGGGCYSNLPFMLSKEGLKYRNNTTLKKSMTFQALRYVPMCWHLWSSSSSVCSSFWSDLGCCECFWPQALNKMFSEAISSLSYPIPPPKKTGM